MSKNSDKKGVGVPAKRAKDLRSDHSRKKVAHIECPVCKGMGKMPNPRHINKTTKPDRARKSAMCRAMSKAGYSYQEMAAFLGYKSKRSISVLLGKPQSK